MQSFIVCLLVGVATAANTYIPPSTNFEAPLGGGPSYDASAQQQTQYGGPSQGGRDNSADAQATILKYENSPNAGDGSYSYMFETSNGIRVQEQGYNTQQGPENSEQVVTGSYSYIGDDGQTYTVTYKADANGFQPQGDHLPTPPPIPAEIQKSLDLIQSTLGGSQQGYPSSNSQQSYDSQAGYKY